ncbi:hypothetical protein GWI33_014780 [Rhynchophorus ferrugineus]|uniref:HTH La-type RNA-binding domain-containing protein n=1 Tax=Rhynchophorus ferrugineus TaxID=354439 RepID=A0A834I3T6_RHYFE|nr:hypothetical protein GWI33_014780 [Rhynchophorus ferrugineus]
MNGEGAKHSSGAAYVNAVPDPSGTSMAGPPGGAVAPHQTHIHHHEYIPPTQGPVVPVQHVPIVNGVAEIADGSMMGPQEASGPTAHPAQSQQPPSSSYSLTQLKQMLSQQLEYYFSRENLANDTYLLSQMDNDQYVPIWTVANFNQVKKLTKDIKLITEVLRESPNVQVDEEGLKVRPNHKRCIVILREIPDNTPLEEVKNLFSGENCPRVISCEFAHNGSWYVTFESDDDAQKAYRFLREEVRVFQGRPIMARIKAKPMCRPIVPVVPPPPPKNGFRATPPPQAVFETAAFPAGQQRFVYANGAPGQPVTAAQAAYNQMVYPSPFQQQQFPYMAWAPSAPSYFDLSSVFQVNGLAPQAYKHQSYRPTPGRPRNKQRNAPQQQQQQQTGSSEQQQGPSNSQQTRVPSTAQQGAGHRAASPTHAHQNHQFSGGHPSNGNVKTSSKVSGGECAAPRASLEPQEAVGAHYISASMPPMAAVPILHPDSRLDMFSYVAAPPLFGIKEAQRHRRKKRDEEPANGSSSSGGISSNANGQSTTQTQTHSQAIKSQFDFVDEAFPPLPGLDANGPLPGKHHHHQQQHIHQAQQTQSHAEGSTQTVNHSGGSLGESASAAAWGENRLADVVKGVAKAKIKGEGPGKEAGGVGEGEASPRAVSPKLSVAEKKEEVVAVNSSAGSPPDSPHSFKSKPISATTTTKCTMADKSTKTDDALLNGCDQDLGPLCPTTTNAATMTTVISPTEAPARPSNTITSNSIYSRQDSKGGCPQPVQAPSPPLPESQGHPPRMSYAQVAQHHRDNQGKPAKQQPPNEKTPTEVGGAVQTTTSKGVAAIVTPQAQGVRSTPPQQPAERDTSVKENRDAGHKVGGARANPSNRQGGHDRPPRRKQEARQSQLRDYATPRSPK